MALPIGRGLSILYALSQSTSCSNTLPVARQDFFCPFMTPYWPMIVGQFSSLLFYQKQNTLISMVKTKTLKKWKIKK